MNKLSLKKLTPLIGIILLGIAIFVIRREIAKHGLDEIMIYLRAIPAWQIGLAIVFMILNYTSLTMYDFLALRYVGKKISYPKIAMTSFISYTFSHSIGMSLLSGTSVRYRFYSSWDINTSDVLRIIAFTSITFWIGFMNVGAISFLLNPVEIPPSLHLPFENLRPLGLLLTLPVVIYLLISIFRRKPFKFKKIELVPPSFKLAISQLAASGLDWAFAAGTLYILLPAGSDIGYLTFITIFALAQVSGVISQVPAGLGVLEGIVLFFLKDKAPTPAIIGALIAFRCIYYLIPLVIASTALGIFELRGRILAARRLIGVKTTIRHKV